MLDDDRGVTDDVWQQIVELGWIGLLVPEEHGGLGLGLRRPGRACSRRWAGRLFPGPFFSSAVLATLAARRLGLDDRLASLAAGAHPGHGRPRRGRATATSSTGSAPGRAARPVAGGSPAPSRSCSTATPPTGCSSSARTQEGLGTFVDRGARDARAACPTWDLDPQGRPPRARRRAGRAGRARRRSHRDLAPGRRRRVRRAVRRAARLDGGRLRPGGRVRQGPRAVRPADRHLPGDQAQGRRHAAAHRAVAGRHALRGVGLRRRRSRAGRGGGHGQGLRRPSRPTM